MTAHRADKARIALDSALTITHAAIRDENMISALHVSQHSAQASLQLADANRPHSPILVSCYYLGYRTYLDPWFHSRCEVAGRFTLA